LVRRYGISLESYFSPTTHDSEIMDIGNRSERFDKIFAENLWGAEGSRSGVGSEAEFASLYVERLTQFLERNQFIFIFDAPCGDLNWIIGIALDNRFHYIGGDISPLVVEDNRLRHPEVDTRILDICHSPFPMSEIWHCRDCLF